MIHKGSFENDKRYIGNQSVKLEAIIEHHKTASKRYFDKAARHDNLHTVAAGNDIGTRFRRPNGK